MILCGPTLSFVVLFFGVIAFIPLLIFSILFFCSKIGSKQRKIYGNLVLGTVVSYLIIVGLLLNAQ